MLVGSEEVQLVEQVLPGVVGVGVWRRGRVFSVERFERGRLPLSRLVVLQTEGGEHEEVQVARAVGAVVVSVVVKQVGQLASVATGQAVQLGQPVAQHADIGTEGMVFGKTDVGQVDDAVGSR